jgi:hypothetical protein
VSEKEKILLTDLQSPPQLATYVKTGPRVCGQVVHWNWTVPPAATVADTLALTAFLWQMMLGSLHVCQSSNDFYDEMFGRAKNGLLILIWRNKT